MMAIARLLVDIFCYFVLIIGDIEIDVLGGFRLFTMKLGVPYLCAR